MQFTRFRDGVQRVPAPVTLLDIVAVFPCRLSVRRIPALVAAVPGMHFLSRRNSLYPPGEMAPQADGVHFCLAVRGAGEPA